MVMVSPTLLLVVVCLLTACEVQTTRYDTLQEARHDQLFERGWVPDVLPESTRSLVEAHDLDTNERCFSAVIPSSSETQIDSTLLGAGFRKQSGSESAPPFDECPFREPQTSEIESLYIRVDSLVGEEALPSEMEYAVLEKEQEFYYWSGSSDQH